MAKLIASQYGDPRLKNRNPYQRYPERSSWVESETYERHDGTRYTRTRTVHRWAAEFAYGEWSLA